MKPKQSVVKRKKDIVLKSDLSFDELLEGAFNDKPLKKEKGNEGMKKIFVLTTFPGEPKKVTKKRSTKKAAPKKKAAKKAKTKSKD